MFPLYRIAFRSAPWRSITFRSPMETEMLLDWSDTFPASIWSAVIKSDKMIQIVYYVNFAIKSIDSCWMLRRATLNLSKNTQYINKWGLNKIKTKNILADWWRVISMDWLWPCNSTKQLFWYYFTSYY